MTLKKKGKVKFVTMSNYNKFVWYALKPYLPNGTVLTSAYRSSEKQLNIIISRAEGLGFKFHHKPTVGDRSSWIGGLRAIRKDNLTKTRKERNPVAPPGASYHQKGLAYDLVGPSLGAIVNGIKKAAADGRIRLKPGIHDNPKQEGVCVHVVIDLAFIDSEVFEIA